MKMISLILLLILSLNSCASANKGKQVQQSSYPTSTWAEDNDMIETRVVKVYVTSKNNMMVKGLCYVETKEDREPCENITLHLVDHENSERLESVTNEVGSFNFTPKDRRPRSIEVKSSRYKLKAGKVIVQAGTVLTIVLVKK